MDRSGSPTFSLPSGMPLDAGRDTSGIYRHIAREESVPQILDKGEFYPITWWQIVNQLIPPAENRDEVIHGNIVDTVLFDELGKPRQYLYTNLEGNFALKGSGACRPTRLAEEFLKIGSRLQPTDIDKDETFIACETDCDSNESDTANFLTKANLDARLRQPHQMKSMVLQCFVPSKGGVDGMLNRTYCTSFWLDRTARHHVKTDRVGMSTKVSGNRHKTTTANKNRTNNKQMEDTMLLVVQRVQRVFKCRVVKMSLEFVQDVNGDVWLYRSTETLVAFERPSQNRNASPEQYKGSRIEAAAEFGDTALKAAAGLDEGFSASRSSKIGRHSDARVGRRVERLPVPDEDAVQAIMLGPRHKLGSRGGSRGTQRQSRSPSPNRHGSPSGKGTTGKPKADTFRVVGARLDSEIPIAESTKMFGSTQIRGCQGDFCKFDVGFIESQGAALNAGKRDTTLSEFRQKLLNKGGPVADDAAGVSSHLTAMMKGHRDDGSVFPEESLTSTDGLQKIAYRTIMQARQEMPLVKLQLNRHKRNEKGDYVTEENYQDIAVSSRLPAHYYKDANVCINCFKVYTIVSEAREKALYNMEARKRKETGLAEASFSGSMDSLFTSSRASRALQQKTLKGGSLGASGSVTFADDSSTATGESSAMFSPVKLPGRTMKEGMYTAPTSVSSGPTGLATGGGSSISGDIALDARDSLRVAVAAIDSLTKLDVAEMRTMTKPPAAVEVVLEAVMALLTGKSMTFQDTRRLLGGGEAFLVMLREFKLEDVTDARLRLVEPYADNPVFRPENVVTVSYAASKFCAWVLGVVQAARWQRGYGHKKTDFYKSTTGMAGDGAPRTPMAARLGGTLEEPSIDGIGSVTSMEDTTDLTFVQKLERKKARRRQQKPTAHTPGSISRSKEKRSMGGMLDDKPRSISPEHTRMSGSKSMGVLNTQQSSMHTGVPTSPIKQTVDLPTSKVPGHSRYGGDDERGGTVGAAGTKGKKRLTDRERTAMMASQKKAADRLSSHNKTDGNMGAVGQAKEFRCADGITKMPYIVLGSLSLEVKCCNFIVVHDFFDTADATAIMFKQLVQRHTNMQAMCFNYPGQANTVWPRLPAEERARGAKEPILNNDFIADRLHELLQHAEEEGDILLSTPFHLVGIGNGACIAAAFCQRWGNDPRYRNSLRSMVSMNGFLYPDPQLSSILHSAAQVFESTPHNRPDIPISYWSRFVFSEDYLQKVNPNLALNIYTAVSNPITSDGRAKITRGCLQHRDIRGGLSPDHVPPVSHSGGVARGPVHPVQVPIIVLQATEDTLVSAANVDPFLAGRTTKHLWSHQLNNITENMMVHAADPNGGWVGRRSSGPDNYPKYSILGKNGLTMLLDTLKNPRGAFVMWVRSGHALMQENKAAMMDIIDALVVPTPEYTGLVAAAGDGPNTLSNSTAITPAPEPAPGIEETKTTAKMEVLFKLKPPGKAIKSGETRGDFEEDIPIHEKDTADAHAAKEQALMASGGGGSKSGFEVVMPMPEKPDTAKQDMDTQQDGQESRPFSSQPFELENTAVEPPRPETPVGLDVDGGLSQLTMGDTLDGIESLSQVITSPITSPVPILNNDSSMNFNASFGSAVHTHPSFPERLDEDSVSLGIPSGPGTVDLDAENLTDVEGFSPGQSMSADLRLPSPRAKEPKLETELEPIVLPSVAASQALERPGTSDEDGFAHAAISDEPPARLLEIPDLGSDMDLNKKQSSLDQRVNQQWVASVPDPAATQSLERELKAREKQFLDLEEQARVNKAKEASVRIAKFDEEQAQRRQQYEDEDKALLTKLQAELEARRRERDAAERQRRLEIQAIEKDLVSSGIVQTASLVKVDVDETGMTSAIPLKDQQAQAPEAEPVEELPPMRYEHPVDLPATITAKRDAVSLMDEMKKDEEEARKRGNMSMEEFEQVKMQMAARQMERDQKLRHLATDEQEELFSLSGAVLQRVGRGYNGRKRARQVKEAKRLDNLRKKAVLKAQCVVRGFLGRRRFKRIQRIYQLNLLQGQSVVAIQSVFRGYVARRYFKRVRRFLKAREIQRVVRGRFGRMAAAREKYRLTILRKKNRAAATIQSTWRMKVAREEFRSLRIHVLAAIEVQRSYRGYLGRKQFSRRRQWESTAPGPERIKLGLQLIDESKVAFERQQEEIDALHRAQERAEARVSHIHSEMKESEKELQVLERELTEIDQIERDLQTLSHEKDLLLSGINDAAGMPHSAAPGHAEVVMGQEPNHMTDPDLERRRRAEAYALEMTIQIKRAEREKKRQELETEFAVVFQEVEKKKRALERLEAALADMEATRERKDREFRRLQKNLMQLLLEQKQELDDLREKGIELETATAMTAAAATATALKAKEHEKRSKEMFGQTEELMKFQFMSMSLSYFSSLNMLKGLRDMNADTTSAAVASSADAAAAAAAAASAANLPNIKKMELGANDFVDLSIQKKKSELAESARAESEAKRARQNPLPENVKLWSVSDVCNWMDALFLGQYAQSFREAAVDGPFLMELREEDMVQVLGIKHKLHVRKILVSREKLKPLTAAEKQRQAAVAREEAAELHRDQMGVPDMDTVFSQARNSRTKRVEESLNLGFKIDTEDERGNTLLLTACQNSNKRLVEMLIIRGANINHQNALGNTALHFALAFDAEGNMGEYLIEHGADDTIENVDGLTCYDGLAGAK